VNPVFGSALAQIGYEEMKEMLIDNKPADDKFDQVIYWLESINNRLVELVNVYYPQGPYIPLEELRIRRENAKDNE
jgi:hypothetical protein